MGETEFIPFEKDRHNQTYRLIIRKRKSKSKQTDLFTQDDCEYRAIVTNDKEKNAVEIYHFYNQRSAMEKQFDILKNDFGWNNMPFSSLADNNVFIYFTAICRNLYNNIIKVFSKKHKGLKPNFRMKKFLFRFMILPSNWITMGRQKTLSVYGHIHYKT